MRVAWIGLGNMGGPMAANLVGGGHQVVGFDIGEQARRSAAETGVRITDSVAATVVDAEIVFTMLPAGDHVRAVLSGDAGILAHIRPGTLVVDSSTIDAAAARDLHALVTSAGRRFLDAPVSGGVHGAQAGTLTYMVGGSAGDLVEVRPLLERMGGRIFHAGGAGAGQSAKIANNMMLAVNLAGLCEGMVLADRLGLDASTFFDIATASTGDSWALRHWCPSPGVVETAAVNRAFTGGFATDLALKDLQLALAAGHATDTPLVVAALVERQLARVSDSGNGALDCTALVRLVDGSLGADPPR